MEDWTVLLKDRTVLFKARKMTSWESEKNWRQKCLFFLTKLFFSAKIVARRVLFAFIVEAAEIFVKFEEKVFNKLKERFIKNKTGW